MYQTMGGAPYGDDVIINSNDVPSSTDSNGPWSVAINFLNKLAVIVKQMDIITEIITH